nr:hypothetical protein [Tanacetum cinerariifolium]
MTGNLKLLINFFWKFMGTVRFGNDHVAAILGFGDLQWGMILITRVYFVEGLGHNLFSVGQFCLLKFKYYKEHLCTSCEQGKSKKASHPPKPVPNSRQRLHLLHMDLCRPMRIASINGKRYILVIVDDYSRYTWVYFLRSKDEAPENQVLKVYFDSVGISHQMSSVRTPQQNGVVERQNRTLVEAARTMLIFSRAPLFLWAEAIATAKLDISFLHVFGALCYPKNDREDIGKLGAKGSSSTSISSLGSSRNVECSNCKYLLDKITVLEATVDMYTHPEQQTVNSAALFHEVYNNMRKLDLE